MSGNLRPALELTRIYHFLASKALVRKRWCRNLIYRMVIMISIVDPSYEARNVVRDATLIVPIAQQDHAAWK